MKNFTGQKFGIILKDWTSVIKLKNSNGNADTVSPVYQLRVYNKLKSINCFKFSSHMS
jgi:hypothetical protein